MNDELLPAEPFDDAGSDPGFDLRRGLTVLIVVMVAMVVVTLICVWLADR